MLAANVFYLLAFYQVLKIVRDALILSESGAVAASYASAGMALLLFVFVPAYGALASRVNRVWLISAVTIFFASHLLIFYALGSAGVRIGVAFYIWIGVFNMVAVAQFWAFANDLYTNERGKRLFPLVGIGASLGALVGAALTAFFFKGIGPYSLMLIAAFGLLVPVALTIIVHRREGRRKDTKKEEAEKPVGGPGGFTLVFKQRYLLLIAMLVLVYNLVNTLGGFMLNTLIEQEASRVAAATAGATDDEVRAAKAAVAGRCLALWGPTSTCWRSCFRRSSSRGYSSTSVCAARCSFCRRSPRPDTRPLRSYRPSSPCSGRRSSRTALTTRSRTPPGKRFSFPPAARPSTRRSRRSTRSSFALATCCRPAWCTSAFNWP